MATTTQTTDVKVSPPGTLVWKDWIKAFVLAVFTSPLTIIYTSLQAGNFNINWTAVGIAAATSGLAYILKQLSSTTVTLASVILLIMCLSGITGSAQSMFSPYPKPELKTNLFAKAVVGPFDSIPAGAPTYTAFRFQGPTVMYATSFKNLNQADVFTFFFLSYQKGTFDAPSNKYYTNWAIAIGAGEGGQFAPSSVSAVTALAVALSTQKIGKTNLPFLLTVGAIYNLTTKQGMPAVGPGIPLNN